MTKRRCIAALRQAVLISVVLGVHGCSEGREGSVGAEADLLFFNGNVLTLDDVGTIASTLVVRDGKVVAVGSQALLSQYHAAQTIDLEGKTLMPGFIDTHVHISGRPNHYIDLTEVTSVAQIRSLVAAKVAELGNGKWVTGYGWSEDELEEQRRPLRQDIDTVAPDNPVMLTRAGAHSAVFSSSALALAGIDSNTPDPEGGVIERDEEGVLNGVIRERHNELVGHLIPESDWASLRPSLVEELNDLFRLGITSITQANGTIDYYSEWQQVYADNPGRLPRASVQHYWAGTEAMSEFRERAGAGDEFLRVGPIKLLADGGFTGPAAYTKKPYKGEDEYRGKLNLPAAEIEEILQAAHADGWQLGVHAIGDAAIELVVDILGRAIANHPREDHRHYLNHFTVMPSTAAMDRMAELGIAISQQPNFLYTLEGRYVANLDGERLAHNNPMATPMKHGIHVAMSSDILPLGPWVGIYAAVTRKGMSGAVYGEEEKITREAALRAYTSKGAYLTREEELKGRLQPGMLADLIVLDKDPLAIDEDELLNLEARQTYLGGQLVYQR